MATNRDALDDAAMGALAKNGAIFRLSDGGAAVHPEPVVTAILDALIARVPSVCPSGFDWTADDIEDWLRAVKEGRV